jgi:hypothetical protein
VRALTRGSGQPGLPAGAEAARWDTARPATLAAALAGTSAVFVDVTAVGGVIAEHADHGRGIGGGHPARGDAVLADRPGQRNPSPTPSARTTRPSRTRSAGLQPGAHRRGAHGDPAQLAPGCPDLGAGPADPGAGGAPRHRAYRVAALVGGQTAASIDTAGLISARLAVVVVFVIALSVTTGERRRALPWASHPDHPRRRRGAGRRSTPGWTRRSRAGRRCPSLPAVRTGA